MTLNDLTHAVLTMPSDSADAYRMRLDRIKTMQEVTAKHNKIKGVLARTQQLVNRHTTTRDNLQESLDRLMWFSSMMLGDKPFYIKLSKYDELNAKLDDCPNILPLFDLLFAHNWLQLSHTMGLVSQDAVIYLVTSEKSVVCVNRAKNDKLKVGDNDNH
jgi:hypothetical protein